MWAALWWIAKVTFKVVAWAITHPVASIVVGGGLLLGAAYLTEQDWWGAQQVATLVGAFGSALVVTGVGSLLGKAGLGWFGKLKEIAGAGVAWWWYMRLLKPGI